MNESERETERERESHTSSLKSTVLYIPHMIQ